MIWTKYRPKTVEKCWAFNARHVQVLLNTIKCFLRRWLSIYQITILPEKIFMKINDKDKNEKWTLHSKCKTNRYL